MNLYGKDLFWFGIILMAVVLAAAVIFVCVHLIASSKLKKQLESEYGPQNK